MSSDLLVVLLLGIAAATFIWWLTCLIQAVKTPDSQWASADQSKLLYVLLMVLLGLLGTIIYAAVARPALRRAGASI